jgi:hypothetical protein
MKQIHISHIRDAIKYGNENNYVLFKEIRLPSNFKEATINPATAKMIDDCIQYSETIANQPPIYLPFNSFIEFQKIGDRLNYERLYFKSQRDLHRLVIAQLFMEDHRFIAAIEERLWTWCNSYSWELPAHVPLTPESIEKLGFEGDEVVALFSAETGFYFAEILSLLENQLNPLLVHRLEKEIERRNLKSYDKRNFAWEEAKMNWASVCAGSIGCTAIYRVKNDQKLAQIIHRVIGTMGAYLEGFDNNGITTEGLGYWHYGFSFYLYFSELLKERTCGKIDLMKWDDRLKRIAEFPLYAQFPNGDYINFSDAPSGKWYGEYSTFSKLQEIYDIQEYLYFDNIDTFQDHTSKWALLARNIFWFLHPKCYDPSAVKTGTYFFDDSQWLISREIDERNRFYAFAAKGGHNDEPHNHNDLGNFILHLNDETFFSDLGAPEYVKDFFMDKRYSFLHASSKGHSVPVINDQFQSAGRQFSGKVTMLDLEASKMRIDLRDAYAIEELLGFNRTFEWNPHELLVQITDEFRFLQGKNSVEEVFITHLPVVEIEKGIVLIKGEHCEVTLSFNADGICYIIEENYQNHFGIPSKVNRIRIIYTDIETSKQVHIKIQGMYP